MEKTIEKSEQQAEIIKQIAIYVYFLDVDYCKDVAKEMINKASRQESMAVLNPMHPQEKNDILRMKGNALLSLCDYVDSLKEIEKLKGQLKATEETRNQISKLFI